MPYIIRLYARFIYEKNGKSNLSRCPNENDIKGKNVFEKFSKKESSGLQRIIKKLSHTLPPETESIFDITIQDLNNGKSAVEVSTLKKFLSYAPSFISNEDLREFIVNRKPQNEVLSQKASERYAEERGVYNAEDKVGAKVYYDNLEKLNTHRSLSFNIIKLSNKKKKCLFDMTFKEFQEYKSIERYYLQTFFSCDLGAISDEQLAGHVRSKVSKNNSKPQKKELAERSAGESDWSSESELSTQSSSEEDDVILTTARDEGIARDIVGTEDAPYRRRVFAGESSHASTSSVKTPSRFDSKRETLKYMIKETQKAGYLKDNAAISIQKISPFGCVPLNRENFQLVPKGSENAYTEKDCAVRLLVHGGDSYKETGLFMRDKGHDFHLSDRQLAIFPFNTFARAPENTECKLMALYNKNTRVWNPSLPSKVVQISAGDQSKRLGGR